MPIQDGPTTAQRVVVAYVADPHDHASVHERAALAGFARQLAALRGDVAGEPYDPLRPCAGHLYFVPNCTLTSNEARALGIHGHDDLFGGVVPHRFVGSKAISHPLLQPDAAAPAGWQAGLAGRMGDAVLAGYTAFSLADARVAGLRLLARGPVRLKPVMASGGRGQAVARDAAGLDAELADQDPGELVAHGLVLEEHLNEVRTFSVGQVRVADLLASYFGHQRLTTDNQGRAVYGGSDLAVVRGGFEVLLAHQPAPGARAAIEQAGRYDAAVRSCFPAFFASRSNYDVAVGRDGQGRLRSGVLEQSWRVGGATGPELAALEVFRRDPGRTSVRTAGFEIFGDVPEPPPGATVHFRGIDPVVGPLTKYTVVEPDDHAR